MSKHTQQLVLILIIGMLAGYAIGNMSVGSESEKVEYDESLTKVVVGNELDLPIGATETMSSAKVFPLPKTVPANTRVGLSVLDQQASLEVLVANISVTEPTWVAIYEDVNGVPGSILGAKKVLPLDKFTAVPLLRPSGLTKGSYYFATLLADNGDGVFDRKSDVPTPDNVVIVKFFAQ